MVSGGAAGVVVEIYGERARSRVPLVSWARQGADAAVVVGRLYYTEVLEARTSVSPAAPVPVSAGRSDAELVLCCYQREGPSGLEKLEGDFAVVVWDGRRRLFVARRDPFGAYPLFWTRVGGTTAFATGLAPLAGSSRSAPSTPVSWPRASWPPRATVSATKRACTRGSAGYSPTRSSPSTRIEAQSDGTGTGAGGSGRLILPPTGFRTSPPVTASC